MDFRFEIFNLLNHANFSQPKRTVFAGVQNVEAALAAAGQITSTANTSRQIQVALKLLF